MKGHRPSKSPSFPDPLSHARWKTIIVLVSFPEPGRDEVPLRALPSAVFPAAGRLRGPRPARRELVGDRAGGWPSFIAFSSSKSFFICQDLAGREGRVDTYNLYSTYIDAVLPSIQTIHAHHSIWHAKRIVGNFKGDLACEERIVGTSRSHPVVGWLIELIQPDF